MPLVENLRIGSSSGGCVSNGEHTHTHTHTQDDELGKRGSATVGCTPRGCDRHGAHPPHPSCCRPLPSLRHLHPLSPRIQSYLLLQRSLMALAAAVTDKGGSFLASAECVWVQVSERERQRERVREGGERETER